jgi:HSP20 family protein
VKNPTPTHPLHVHSLEDNFDEMARTMEAMMEGMSGPTYFRSSGRDSWDPPVNVYELDDRLVICVELAGVRPNELDVQVDRGVLHIRGQRGKPVVPDAHGDIRVHLMEIDSGRFHRKIPVPPDLDIGASSASYKNGFVWVILPRRGNGPSSESE